MKYGFVFLLNLIYIMRNLKLAIVDTHIHFKLQLKLKFLVGMS